MTFPKQDQAIRSDGLQYDFGPFCLRPDGTLLRSMATVALPMRELSVLRLLLARVGEIVPAEELREQAWAGTHVSADSLPRCISSLRARLNYEDSIQTIYKQGYRFNIPVKKVATVGSRKGKEMEWTERRATRPRGLPRLAILPFTSGLGVPIFFGTGIAEETMLRLSRTRNPVVEVLARDSVRVLVAKGTTPVEIGSTLQADLVLHGTITSLPQHFRLRAEMVRVMDSVQLWIEDFLVPRQLLAYADARIAKRVNARIRDMFARPIAAVSLAASFEELPGIGPLDEGKRTQAYGIYMQARTEWNTMERHRMQDAIRRFHQAVELDHGLISARIQLVQSYLIQSYCGYMRPDVAAEMARSQAEAVLACSPDGRSVHPALGWIHFHHDRNLVAAREAFARPQGSEYNPATVIYDIKFLVGQGHLNEALCLIRSSLEKDPYSPTLHSRLAWTLHLAGDADTALQQIKHALSLFPRHMEVLFYGAIIFASASGNTQESRSALAAQGTLLASKLIELAPSLDSAYATLAYAQARQGRISEARSLIERLQWLGQERYVQRSFLAPALVELGDYDAALEELSIAERMHCPSLFEVLVDPRLAPVHDKPEYLRLKNILEPMQSHDASVA